MIRIDAIKAVSRNLRDLVLDSIPASLSNATGTIFIDVGKLIQPESGQLKGYNHYIYEGAASGEEHRIIDFLPANNRMVFGNLFTAAPSINSKFLIFQYWGKDEYDNAVDRMIGRARASYLEDKVATLAIVATQYEYPVPSGFKYISDLKLVPSGNTDYSADDEISTIFELNHTLWSILPNAKGSYMIKFDARKIDLDNLDDEWLNVVGQAEPDISATDNANIPTPIEEYVINGASAIMASSRIGENVTNREWYSKFIMFKDTTNRLEEYIFRHKRGKFVS